MICALRSRILSYQLKLFIDNYHINFVVAVRGLHL